jgi:hypothetical protein
MDIFDSEQGSWPFKKKEKDSRLFGEGFLGQLGKGRSEEGMKSPFGTWSQQMGLRKRK